MSLPLCMYMHPMPSSYNGRYQHTNILASTSVCMAAKKCVVEVCSKFSLVMYFTISHVISMIALF